MNDKQTIKKCDVCNGTGKQWFNIDMISGTEECKYCNGTGEDITTKQTIKERVKASILTLLNKKINHAKIRILKRVCHTMKCYKEMSGDCRQCQTQKELKQITEGK